MNSEILFGIVTIFAVAIWAAQYIRKRNKENNNEHLFDFIPHLFPTLGILFTFLGIAIGLWNFDSNNIEKSIPELMDGLKTAFIVSIFGVALLVVFSFWTNIKRKSLEEGVQSEETKAIYKLVDVITELRSDLSFKDDHGNIVKAGNVLREIYEESCKQSNALQTFSSDLALTISEGFQEILNNPSEGVVAELKLVRAEIEGLANKLKDPTTEMTQSVVKELQLSMSKMIEEFKNSMSGDTKHEMEKLASIISDAGSALLYFPDKLSEMTQNLNENFQGVQEMVNAMSKNAKEQSLESVQQMRLQLEQFSKVLNDNVGDLQSGQQGLMVEQSKNLENSLKLQLSFNDSLGQMSELSKELNNTITKINKAQGDLQSAISSVNNTSLDVKAYASKLSESQLQFAKSSHEFVKSNADSIKEIRDSLHAAKDLSKHFAEKFVVIESGLTSIFSQIEEGLKQYQITVSSNLDSTLVNYSEHFTNATEALKGVLLNQESLLEEIIDILPKNEAKKK